MTLDDIARKLDTIDTRLATLERKVDDGFTAAEKNTLLLGLANLESQVDDRFSASTKAFATLESKLDEGFNASKIRDEELHRLTRFGLEAGEIMHDSIIRRFDSSDRKHDEQISLLKDVIRQHPTKS